jgi:acyl CoA:acetate/3-ketoacid CoA transferase
MSPEAAAALVADGATVSVSSSSGLGCPDRMMAALGERFAGTGSPRGLTALLPIAAGDMYGIGGIDHWTRPGMLSTVIAGSYPSGPSSMAEPAIWRMIRENEVAAYNVPSGVLFDLHREAARARLGVLTEVGLDTYADPARDGCAMNERARAAPIVKRVAFEGRDLLYYHPVAPDVALIRATTGDSQGNLSFEHEGALLGARELALAVRNRGGLVIAQVKRLTEVASRSARDIVVPGHLVDAVVLAPDQRQTTETDYDPAISGEVRRPTDAVEIPEFGLDLVIARRVAMELAEGDTAVIGFGISALAPRVLLAEGLHGQVTWAIEQGATGGLPLLGFQFGCSVNADAIMPSPLQFTLFQGGGADIALLSFLEADRDGNVNVTRLKSTPHVTAGAGGFVDITAGTRRVVFSGRFDAGGARVEIAEGGLKVAAPGRFTKLVDAVDHVSFSGPQARARGHEIMLVTERSVMTLTGDGWRLDEVAPGVDPERDVLQRIAFPVARSPALKTMDARLFRPEAMALSLKPTRRGA